MPAADPVTYSSETVRIGPAPAIAVEFAGDGDPVVFLHGVGGRRADWSEQLPAFSGSFRAMAWDARGYGDSDDYAGPASIDDFCVDLLRVIDHLSADKVHVVGLSMGGFIAQEFYHHSPERVRSLVLAGTSSGFPANFDARWIRDFLDMRCIPLRNGQKLSQIADQVARALVSESALPAIRGRAAESIVKLRQDVYVKTLEAICTHRIKLDHGRVSVPTLVIVGAEDQIMPPRASMDLAKIIPGAELKVLEGAGHLINIEKPREFNHAILDFLDRKFPD